MDANERARETWNAMLDPRRQSLDVLAEAFRSAEADARREALEELATIRALVEEDKQPPLDWYPLFTRGNAEAERVYRTTHEFCAAMQRRALAARAAAVEEAAKICEEPLVRLRTTSGKAFEFETTIAMQGKVLAATLEGMAESIRRLASQETP